MKNKKTFFIILLLMIVTLVGVSGYYWYNNTYYVKTEDAKVDADVVRVSPQMGGKIVSIDVKEGDRVKEGQVLARIDDENLPPGANLDRTLVRAPIGGVVAYVPAHEGEMGGPGKPVAMLVDTSDFHISANIEETNLNKVKPGQYVDITLDNIPGKVFKGEVESIRGASLSTFSLLPSNNASGNFTKVVQRVPVTVSFNSKLDERMIVGTNAIIRIHVK